MAFGGMTPSRCADEMTTGVLYVLAESEDDPGYVWLEAEARMNASRTGPSSELNSLIFNLNELMQESGASLKANESTSTRSSVRIIRTLASD